ncbi:HD-GYP domain-containing protein [Paenibacillus nasutitermitis]|nr:HD-GYP domain-containing protein [Paenibacillus nasutitermitis]
MRINKNMYNEFGALIVPANALLNRKSVRRLYQHRILLQEEDVENLPILHLLNSAIVELKEVFHNVRHFNSIPTTDIRNNLVPIIIEMSNHMNLKQVFSHFGENDEYTYRHIIGVALISRLIGKAKGYDGEELLNLTIAGFLHDIGKAKISEAILNKPGKLTLEEFQEMRKHTVYGFDMIKQTPGLNYRHALVALEHHEREDGSGYPHGKRGCQMDPFSKIVAVADVFHAMISKRVYKEPIPFYHVLLEMSRSAYGLLEPDTTLCFLKRIMDMLIGSDVRLSNGQQGRIVMVCGNEPLSPLIKVKGQYMDLSRDRSVQIEQIV